MSDSGIGAYFRERRYLFCKFDQKRRQTIQICKAIKHESVRSLFFINL